MQHGKVRPATIYSHLSYLTRFHTENGLDWSQVRNHPTVIAFLRYKINTFRPAVAREPRSPPVTLSDLERFCASLQSDNYDDIMLGACASILFWGLGRLPEVLHPDGTRPMRVSSLLKREGVWQPFLERPKVRKDYDQFLFSSDLDTVSSSAFWLTLLSIVTADRDPHDLLWTFQDGTILTRKKFMEIFTSTLGYSIGFYNCSSFRAGGATEFLRRKVGVEFIRLRER